MDAPPIRRQESSCIKEPTWNTLVTGIRHGKRSWSAGRRSDRASGSRSRVEALRAHLAAELEAERIRVTGETLAAIAQQYEDGGSWRHGTQRMRRALLPLRRTTPAAGVRSPRGAALSLVLTSCQDDSLAGHCARGKVRSRSVTGSVAPTSART
jgi:hypothetical protein